MTLTCAPPYVVRGTVIGGCPVFYGQTKRFKRDWGCRSPVQRIEAPPPFRLRGFVRSEAPVRKPAVGDWIELRDASGRIIDWLRTEA